MFSQLFSTINNDDTMQILIASSTLYNLQLCYNLNVMGFDLAYWIKPCNITWFFIFLLIEYDDGCWIQNFHMSKETLFDIANKLKFMIVKKNTWYHVAILVKVRVACVIYKLFHGSNHLITKSITGLVLHEVIKAINIIFKNLIAWLVGQHMKVVILEFKN